MAALCFLLIPSSISVASRGGGGGGGTVVGKCGTITSISGSAVQLSASSSGYTATPLQIRGQAFNCSIYLQSYWIDFDEPTNTSVRAVLRSRTDGTVLQTVYVNYSVALR